MGGDDTQPVQTSDASQVPANSETPVANDAIMLPQSDDPRMNVATKYLNDNMDVNNLTPEQRAQVLEDYNKLNSLQPGQTVEINGEEYTMDKDGRINGDDNDIRAYADKAAVDLAWKLGKRNHQAKLDSLAREHAILRNKPNLTKEDSLQLDNLIKQAGDIYKRSAQYRYNDAEFRYNFKGFTE